MVTLKRTNSDDIDFINLVVLLDKDLAIRDGEDHAFYAQFNKSNLLKNALIAYENTVPVGIGAYKEYDAQTIEIKRMFTDPEFRKNGLGSAIVKELENWAAELNFKKAVLETSQDLKSAISIYEKSGFYRIPNYGQYIGVEQSVCYEKVF